MYKNKIIGVFFLLVFVVLQGCSVGGNKKSDVSNSGEDSNKGGGIELSNKQCESQYEKVADRNKRDFADCKFTVRTSDFQGEEVVKKKNNTILIFDASGSMAGIVDGRKKIDIAKEAVAKFANQIQGEDVNFGILVYGHKGSNNARDKAVSCSGIEEMYFMGDVNAAMIQKKVNALKPTGWTPIADSLLEAKKKMAKYIGDNNVNSIILVSDGKETCGGSPVTVAKELQNSDLNVVVNVIGFDVGGEDERQLQAVAENGGGDYFSVKNAIDFEYAFKKHKEFMKEFDHKIKNVSVQLADVSSFSDKYFDCFMRLKRQEGEMMLDIYAEDYVDESCQGYAEDTYYEKIYNPLEKGLKDKFDNIMKEWKNANVVTE